MCNQYKLKERTEDLHIHPRACRTMDKNICSYLVAGTKMGIKRFGFVEHGPRISNKHKGIINSSQDAAWFEKNIREASLNLPNEIEVFGGIEIDYSPNKAFMQKNKQIIIAGVLDYVIGSVHGYNHVPYTEYLAAVRDLITNYPIDVLGHFRLSNESLINYRAIQDIFRIIKEKRIKFECNRALRYRCDNPEVKEMILNLINFYDIQIAFGADSHSIDEFCSQEKSWWFYENNTNS